MNSNLTPAEQWRLHGTFTEETAQRLLDAYDFLGRCEPSSMRGTLKEIKGCLPQEDFLIPILRRVALLVKRSRGGGKQLLQEVFNDLHALQEQQNSDTEHAADLIQQLQKDLTH